jgi:hypothetical protein
MLARRIGASGAEKIFIIAKNTYSTASLTNGQAVAWDYVTDKDGVGVTKPPAITTSCGFAAAGVVAETIAAGAYGLIQVYGLHSAALCRSTTGGSITVTHGTPLGIGLEASFALAAMATGYASTVVVKRYFPVAFSLGHITTRTVTGTATAVFIKAL